MSFALTAVRDWSGRMTTKEAKEIIECREMIDAMSERANEALNLASDRLTNTKLITKTENGRAARYCENCGNKVGVYKVYNFCPNCGAEVEK